MLRLQSGWSNYRGLEVTVGLLRLQRASGYRRGVQITEGLRLQWGCSGYRGLQVTEGVFKLQRASVYRGVTVILIHLLQL